MARPRTWIVDAALLQDDADDVEAFRHGILHETDVIADFLSLDGRDRLFVVAPKGFGKTLLLQVKRLMLQQNRRGMILSPANLLVDRPENLPIAWTREQIEGYVGDYGYWTEVWGMAIRIAAVRTLHRAAREEGGERPRPAEPEEAWIAGLGSHRLREILLSPGAPVLSDIFVALLRADRHEYFRILGDVADQINPRCRSIHTGMAFFIDNVDEMFHHSIQDALDRSRGGGQLGARLGDVWTLAQLGLARAAFDINRINPHIRVYTTLRREAWLRLPDFDPNAAQMNGRALEVAYSAEDLKAILRKNAANERDENVVEPRAADPIERFVGAAAARVMHDQAHRPEPLADFILRHTLLRPRDLMLIGSRISELRPPRRSPAAVKEAVYRAAAQLADWYQGEMALFVHKPDRRLYQLIDRNVLTREDLGRIAEAYAAVLEAEQGAAPGEELRHPFCALYKLGLLGVVRTMRDGAAGAHAPETAAVQLQRFAGPDEIVAEGRVGILPRSPAYLVHPSLDHVIEAAHGIDYRRTYETRNVIGHDRPWIDDAISIHILKGDVVGSSRTARHPDFVESYPPLFRSWVEQECARFGVRHHQFDQGDALLLVDQSAAKLLAVARAVLQRMAAFRDHPCTMRFGAASGVVHGMASGVLAGSVLSTAARLEPTAPHGCVIATEAFWADARGAWGEAGARRLDASFKAFRYQNGKFLVRKNSREPATLAELWRIRLLPG